MSAMGEQIEKFGKLLIGLLLVILLFHVPYAAIHYDNFVQYLVSANTILRLGEIFFFLY